MKSPSRLRKTYVLKEGKIEMLKILFFYLLQLFSSSYISLHIVSITIKWGADVSGISYLSPLRAADLSESELWSKKERNKYE